ncbi:MAG: hypothetical protein CMM58_11705 [Rhodospirillaceae bacterium]|nr:hypothetical protein [Rhodospirillaceae bacterium]|tara:strand:- start:408 stop:1139 length:732 start_codon:yes stop_codon:yes gene_type:complete
MNLTILLTISNTFGAVACFTGIIGLLARKGSGIHRVVGRIFFISLLGVVGAEIWVNLHANEFTMFLVALLSGYFGISGYRCLYLNRSMGRYFVFASRPGVLDKGLAQLNIIICLALSFWAGINLQDIEGFLKNVSKAFEITTLLTLSLLGLVISYNDIRRFRAANIVERDWLRRHSIRMIISFVGVGILVLENNFVGVPEIVRWLLPVALGIPLMVFWCCRITRWMKNDSRITEFVNLTDKFK